MIPLPGYRFPPVRLPPFLRLMRTVGLRFGLSHEWLSRSFLLSPPASRICLTSFPAIVDFPTQGIPPLLHIYGIIRVITLEPFFPVGASLISVPPLGRAGSFPHPDLFGLLAFSFRFSFFMAWAFPFFCFFSFGRTFWMKATSPLPPGLLRFLLLSPTRPMSAYGPKDASLITFPPLPS